MKPLAEGRQGSSGKETKRKKADVIQLHAKCDKVKALRAIVEQSMVPFFTDVQSRHNNVELNLCAACAWAVAQALVEQGLLMHEVVGEHLEDFRGKK